ncbi:hypothetical protein P175DRAFT_0538517 [Aspergillus ochraceoroseus IBT 24754]|uniref:BHLH domain-containing protein n=2 Tax=Aspergillus ochraceoroseus TaxID=138278 RepID=A0A2T5M7W2_9EURO|nr:uncharacterized protein P175DRAFT_0538517 [Aspergillus ochraceoroseus IBT 24754]KKK25309.1 hypothetical protein AOCH_003301 [Aspergillus ochraceoroseus]PTU24607.1 hypothetical protein P175DRAFT_0538517 [Aspergillus ochraceoroseus IBT 24754]
MTSLFESDYGTVAPFFPQQTSEQQRIPFVPPDYFLFQGSKETPALSFVPNYPHGIYLRSLEHVQSEYDCFVNSVISNVLIRVEDGSMLSPPAHDEQLVMPNQYPVPAPILVPPCCDDLMWGSDLSFGPNGYFPLQDAPSPSAMERDMLYMYTNSLRPITHRPATANMRVENTMHEKEWSPSPDISEVTRGGVQSITGKKRRRLLHIIAERNRRLNQNKMYEELYRIVPGLDHDTRSTKRKVLTRAADWLEELIEDNKKLQEQLMQLASHPRYG